MNRRPLHDRVVVQRVEDPPPSPGAIDRPASCAEETRSVAPTTIPVLSASCPRCHTLDRSITPESLLAGTGWSCAACGQTWTAARLDAFQRYAAAQ
jgi:hypothetical protein